MNCPKCGAEMVVGYLRGSRGYALLWTDDPFRMTSLPIGEDFWLCKETEVEKPTAFLCRGCKLVLMQYR